MSCRRSALVALAGAALVLTSCPTAGADPKHPSQAELDAARARVSNAQHDVSSLQSRAEAAAEAYNGAVADSSKAAFASAQAEGRAVAARARARQAQAEAVQAQQRSEAAAARAEHAQEQQASAQAEVYTARTELGQFANEAYRTGGELTMAAQLMDARSPLEYAQGHALMNSVSAFQQDAVDRLAAAQAEAQYRADVAAGAQRSAAAAVTRATAAVDDATSAQAAAEASSQAAADAARAASAAVARAASAKRTAQALVARAEAALGSAQATSASLQRAAAEARAEAERIRAATLAAARVADAARGAGSAAGGTVAAGSQAAQTAIEWAFNEIGTPYSWGGGNESGPTYGFAQGAHTRGFDCSGLTLFAYGHAGIHLDHYTGSQWQQGKRISSYSDLQPGDLMFFATNTSDPSTIHHVAIYIGGGLMIEAPHTGSVVKVSTARTGDFIGGTRPWA